MEERKIFFKMPIEKERSNNKIIDPKLLLHKNQIEFINKMYSDILFDEKKLCISEINKKINSYKNQDIIKKVNIVHLITLDNIIEKLVISKLKCYYCNNNMNFLYKISRDPLQWTLDRIDNSIGHTNDNVIICCLKCNLERRCKNSNAFLFTKKLNIKKV